MAIMSISTLNTKITPPAVRVDQHLGAPIGVQNLDKATQKVFNEFMSIAPSDIIFLPGFFLRTPSRSDDTFLIFATLIIYMQKPALIN